MTLNNSPQQLFLPYSRKISRQQPTHTHTPLLCHPLAPQSPWDPRRATSGPDHEDPVAWSPQPQGPQVCRQGQSTFIRKTIFMKNSFPLTLPSHERTVNVPSRPFESETHKKELKYKNLSPTLTKVTQICFPFV